MYIRSMLLTFGQFGSPLLGYPVINGQLFVQQKKIAMQESPLKFKVKSNIYAKLLAFYLLQRVKPQLKSKVD